MGFLGGFSWAVLVAHAAQHFFTNNKAATSNNAGSCRLASCRVECIDVCASYVCVRAEIQATALLQHFFHLYSSWKWPRAVALNAQAQAFKPSAKVCRFGMFVVVDC